MVKILWTDIAIEDLKSIHDYIVRDSKRYADRYIEKLIGRVDQLEKFPKSGRVVPSINSPSIRELIEGNYRIVYKVSSVKVSILRVHHAARQLK
ncbi:MAG: type II toxin-antitoxin system RelE/ParE family toxin [Ferruginibacter sp.]